MDARGTEKFLSVYWFVVLFIVAAGVVYMAALFYGEPYDVREIEAGFLNDAVADCMIRGGLLQVDLDSGTFLESCNLNFEVEDTEGWEDDQLYVKVSYSFFDEDEFVLGDEKGNSNLDGVCGGGTSPVCVEKNVYAIDASGVQYKIKILSVVRKTEKND